MKSLHLILSLSLFLTLSSSVKGDDESPVTTQASERDVGAWLPSPEVQSVLRSYAERSRERIRNLIRSVEEGSSPREANVMMRTEILSMIDESNRPDSSALGRELLFRIILRQALELTYGGRDSGLVTRANPEGIYHGVIDRYPLGQGESLTFQILLESLLLAYHYAENDLNVLGQTEGDSPSLLNLPYSQLSMERLLFARGWYRAASVSLQHSLPRRYTFLRAILNEWLNTAARGENPEIAQLSSLIRSTKSELDSARFVRNDEIFGDLSEVSEETLRLHTTRLEAQLRLILSTLGRDREPMHLRPIYLGIVQRQETASVSPRRSSSDRNSNESRTVRGEVGTRISQARWSSIPLWALPALYNYSNDISLIPTEYREAYRCSLLPLYLEVTYLNASDRQASENLRGAEYLPLALGIQLPEILTSCFRFNNSRILPETYSILERAYRTINHVLNSTPELTWTERNRMERVGLFIPLGGAHHLTTHAWSYLRGIKTIPSSCSRIEADTERATAIECVRQIHEQGLNAPIIPDGE